MNRTALYLFIFICWLGSSSNPVSAQRILLEGGVTYTPDFKSSYVESGSYLSYVPLWKFVGQNTVQFETAYRNLYHQTLSSKLGFQMNALLQIPIKSRFELRMGLGLSYQEFRLEKEIVDQDVRLIGTDTLEGEVNIIPQGLCTQYTNNIDDLGEQDPSLNYQLLKLHIPLQLVYRTSNGLSFGATMQASLPLISNVEQQTLQQTQSFENDQVICTYFLDNNSVDGKVNLRDFQWNVGGLITYDLSQRLALGFNIEASLTNVFNDRSTNSDFQHFGAVYKPINFRLTGVYYLN